MRTLIFAAALIAVPPAAQEENFVGEYSLAEGPDVGGGLLIKSNGRFLYLLAAGALDERAEGRWGTQNDDNRQFPAAKPAPPAF
ncbi:MAG: hypothetical protein IBJ13_10030, partial [Sphingopyxis sp.]|nr:hypothetical protein [Sphingopyxis sp.]